nr:YjgN family protein [Herbaspirillum sp. ASV7]
MNDSHDLPAQSDSPVPPDAAPPASFSSEFRAALPGGPEPFSFSARGSEYFRIWIVNLLLSVLTLGIYSAWAKVRRLRYFYDNTSVAGSSFDYHGNPKAILKGRIIAVVLLAVHHFASKVHPMLGLLAALALALAGPWLIWRSLQFKLYNTSYRGIRFGFGGSAGGVFRHFWVWPMLGAVSLGLLAPMAYQRFKRYQHGQTRFGTTQFSFHGSVWAFYKAFLTGAGLWLAGVLVLFFSLGGLGSLASLQVGGLYGLLLVLLLYGWTFTAFPLLMTLLQNLVWNSTRLGEHQFRSTMRWPRAVFISVTNLLGIAFTLGLYTPFAQVRMMRYRIESLTLLPTGSLDDFLASSEAHGSATSEGLGDLLDFDLSM